MAWTYSGNPAASALDSVRFLIGDTDTTNQLLADAEITWLLTTWNANPFVAAYNAAYSLSAKFTGKSDQSKTVGDLSLSTQYLAQASKFGELADRLKVQAVQGYPPYPTYSTDAAGDFFFSVGMDQYKG